MAMLEESKHVHSIRVLQEAAYGTLTATTLPAYRLIFGGRFMPHGKNYGKTGVIGIPHQNRWEGKDKKQTKTTQNPKKQTTTHQLSECSNLLTILPIAPFNWPFRKHISKLTVYMASEKI